jgi:hypothetical protein
MFSRRKSSVKAYHNMPRSKYIQSVVPTMHSNSSNNSCLYISLCCSEPGVQTECACSESGQSARQHPHSATITSGHNIILSSSESVDTREHQEKRETSFKAKIVMR